MTLHRIINKQSWEVDSLYKSIRDKVPISSAEWTDLQRCFEKVLIGKNQYLLQEGRKADHIYFVIQGVFRSYYEHKEREVTSWFYSDNQWLTSWHSFYWGMPSFEYIQAIENSELYCLSKTNYEYFTREQHSFNSFARLLAEEQTAFLDYFSKGYNFMTASEKYNLLNEYFPDIAHRVNLGYIASFLGITQETLSRVRRNKMKS